MISPLKLILNSLIHYKWAHLTVIIGTAISTMVLIGTLIVGDSVESSLENTTRLRLGNIGYTFSGIDRYFRSDLASEIRSETELEVAPLMLLNGIASSQGGAYQANKIAVLGIDDHFNTMIPGNDKIEIPGSNEVLISQNLSERLQLNVGDAILLKLEKASLIPKNAPFVSDEDNQISMRLNVTGILGPEQLGRFNLKTSQTAPYNVFLSLSFINDKMSTPGKVNNLLFKGSPGLNEEVLKQEISAKWKPGDLGIGIFQNKEKDQLELRSERVFIDSVTAETISRFEPDSRKILTYFVNSFNTDIQQTPYSFMSAGPFEDSGKAIGDNEILVNNWLSEDLGVGVGDSLEVSYFTIGPLRRLEEASRWFMVKSVVPIEGAFADQGLMPDLPGLTDAGNCRDWETGVPIKLDQIRDKDEDYWNDYKGIPKAFIGYNAGKDLWENRFGTCTAIRLPASKYTKPDIEKQLSNILNAEKYGFTVKPVLDEGLTAARGGVDFAELFMGLSFFLLVAGLILIALLYNLNFEKRMPQAGTLKAIGYPNKLIQRIMIAEGIFVAIPGVILGSLLAILYNKIIFTALNTVWNDIVRTSVLKEDIRMNTVLTGIILSLSLVIFMIWYNTWRKLRTRPARLQRGVLETNAKRKNRLTDFAGWGTGILALVLLGYDAIMGESLSTALFFSAGGLLLVSFLILSWVYLSHPKSTSQSHLSHIKLLQLNLYINKSRSIRIIMLFALGTFIIVSTGLNKKDLYTGSGDRLSGTGGYLFFGETTVPVLMDLNDPAGKENYGLDQELGFIQMRKADGDDASCLNLNLITQPRILGVNPGDFKNRFSFVKSTDDLNPENPWSSLTKTLPGNLVPAIADQTIIQWGLGMKVGDTLVYKDELGQEMKLKLIGGLANSIFQGNILVDERQFLEHFPSNSGSHVFLVDGNAELQEEARNELERSFRNEGLDLDVAADRLAAFNEVENTYLSIFLILGGLAMILGTIGLGISLARNIIDRRSELAILRVIGFNKNTILNMLTGEHLLLLVTGTLIGVITAFVATLPAILSSFVDASWQTAAIIILVILMNGLAWILMITKSSLKKHLLTSLRTE